MGKNNVLDQKNYYRGDKKNTWLSILAQNNGLLKLFEIIMSLFVCVSSISVCNELENEDFEISTCPNVDAVTRLGSFLNLKLSRCESFRALKLSSVKGL